MRKDLVVNGEICSDKFSHGMNIGKMHWEKIVLKEYFDVMKDKIHLRTMSLHGITKVMKVYVG